METQQPPANKWDFWRIVAVVGDITSITGLSLLFFSQGMEITPAVIVKTVLRVVVYLGFISLIVTLFYHWAIYLRYRKYPVHWSWLAIIFILVFPITATFALFIGRITSEIVDSMVDGITSSERVLRPRPAISPTPYPDKRIPAG